jgi:dTDP-glucose pyrophosphorylase/CBS domain-containing protein
MSLELEALCVLSGASIRDVIGCIDENEQGIALVTDADRHLLGTITDGDIRRAMLAGVSLDSPVEEILVRKAGTPYAQPVTAPADTPQTELVRLMQEREVRQIPLVDAENRVVQMVTFDNLLPSQGLPMQAVIMAGGLGTRLRPLTDDLPKPMLPVGDRPLMERIVEQLRDAGIQRVHVATHFQPEKITKHFGNGESFGVDIDYVEEDQPLGTAGALGLMETPDEPVLVINGDILTRVDFRSMLTYHKKHKSDLTVAVRQYDIQVPYGVIDCEGPYITGVREKPRMGFFVNAGIYLLEPSALRFIPNGKHFDMTELIEKLIVENRTVVSFPIVEYWLDIGQHEDYIQANRDAAEGRLSS